MLKVALHYSDTEKVILLEELKAGLESLPSKIPEIKMYEVGINFSKSENAYDLVLVFGFENKKTLGSYAKHPEHIKVLEIINKTCSEKKVVDFTL